MEYIYSHKNEGNPVIYNIMNGTWEHYAIWNNSDKERQIPYGLIYMWNLKKKIKNKLTDTDNRLMVVRDRGGRWAKWVKGVKRYKLPVIK